MKRFFVLLLALVILLPLCASAETASADSAAEPSPLDQAVAKIFKNSKTVGGEVVVAKDGEIVYQYCYGITTTDDKAPVTPDHYYIIASVSKLVSATALMRLVETGRLDLDENIGTVLGGDEPYFAATRRYPDTGITTRMLMSHTSTIWDKYFPDNKPLRESLNIETTHWGYFYDEKPGCAYHYSNRAVGILGCIMEAVTGKLLNDAASELLFDRMGIDAAYSPALLDHPEMIASSASIARDYPEEIDVDSDFLLTFGGCWIKCSDLCKIGMMLADYGMYNGERILEEDTVREMLSSQTGKGGIVTSKSPYGLNVIRLNYYPELVSDREYLIYGHQGRASDILCNLYFDPETRFVFAFVTNSCNPQGRTHGIRRPASTMLELLWKEFNK